MKQFRANASSTFNGSPSFLRVSTHSAAHFPFLSRIYIPASDTVQLYSERESAKKENIPVKVSEFQESWKKKNNSILWNYQDDAPP